MKGNALHPEGAMMHDQQPYPERSLRDFYYVLFRHKWKIALFFLAVVTTVAAGTLLMPEVYRSEAKILVRLGRESVTLDPTAATGQVLSISRNRENEINSELEILNSRDLAERVVDALGPQAFLHKPAPAPPKVQGRTAFSLDSPSALVHFLTANAASLFRRAEAQVDEVLPPSGVTDREKAVLAVMKDLDTEVLKKSNIIAVSFEAKDPRLAQATLDALLDSFLEKHMAVHRTPGSYRFFDQQTRELRAEIAATEKRLRDLKNRTGVAALTEQRRLLLERIGGLQEQIEAADANLAAAKAKIQTLNRKLAELPKVIETGKTTGFPNYAADGMREQLYKLQLKEQDLLSRYRKESIPVREVRRQIAEAQDLLNRESRERTQITRGLNRAYELTEQDLLAEQAAASSFLARAQALKAQLAGARRDLKELNDTELGIAALERDLEIQKANYRKYTDNLEQARIDQALETKKISNISVVQPATLPIEYIKPRKKLNLALGLFLGLLGGLGLAFFSEYMDHSFKKPEDVEERLQLPALAAIPRAPGRHVRPALKALARLPRLPAEGPPSSAGWSLPQSLNGHFEVLLNRILLCSNGACAPPRTIAVTSCRPNEGASTVAANLALLFSGLNQGRVLLVNADLRSEPKRRTKASIRLHDGC
jgi:uncharacterized protein involved in exopolysaccharide biosynthesis